MSNQRVDDAMAEVRDARAIALRVIQSEYPLNCAVIVQHHRGSFNATVTRICGEYGTDLGYVLVRNAATGKVSKRYYSDLTPILKGQP